MKKLVFLFLAAFLGFSTMASDPFFKTTLVSPEEVQVKILNIEKIVRGDFSEERYTETARELILLHALSLQITTYVEYVGAMKLCAIESLEKQGILSVENGDIALNPDAKNVLVLQEFMRFVEDQDALIQKLTSLLANIESANSMASAFTAIKNGGSSRLELSVSSKELIEIAEGRGEVYVLDLPKIQPFSTVKVP